jgi:hypothetical protein
MKTITAFQDPNTMLFTVEGKNLTRDELNKLMTLQPGNIWIVVTWNDNANN